LSFKGTNSEFTLRLQDVTGAFEVEPTSATGSTSVSIRVANGSLDYENPNQRKFIILVSRYIPSLCNRMDIYLVAAFCYLHPIIHFYNIRSF
jgi:hypothetical protein